MKSLTPESLERHLTGGRHSCAYLVHGGEELIVDECRSMIRSFCKADEHIAVRMDKSGNVDDIRSGTENLSLFGESRHLEVMFCGTPDAKAGKVLAEIARRLDGTGDRIVICMHELEWRIRKTQWFRELQDACTCVAVPKIDRARFPKWVSDRLARSGHSTTSDAMALFVEMTEGNLLAASQELLKISLLFPESRLDADQLRAGLVNLSRHNVFSVHEAIQSRSPKSVGHALTSLRNEGAPEPLVLWALADQARALLAAYEGRRHPGVWGERKTAIDRAAAGVDRARMIDVLDRAQQADLHIKGLGGTAVDPWDDFLSIAGFLQLIMNDGQKVRPMRRRLE